MVGKKLGRLLETRVLPGMVRGLCDLVASARHCEGTKARSSLDLEA